VRTLFVRAGALGDFVVTLPVLAFLLEQGSVDVACGPRFATLLPFVPGAANLGRVFDVGGADASWIFGGRDPVGYDRAVAFSRGLAEGLRAAGVPEVHAVDAVPRGPAAAWFGSVVGLQDPVPRLVVAAGDPSVVLSPGAGAAAKRGDPAWWIALHTALSGLPIVWVLGPQEAGESWPGEVHRLDLPATARRAAGSVWVGPDSGPTHVAAAAGARVVARFTVSDPAVWAPPGAHVVGGGTSPADVAVLVRRLWKSRVQHDISGVSG
jgi:ADP-heptose:LPS heptosyltransferase